MGKKLERVGDLEDSPDTPHLVSCLTRTEGVILLVTSMTCPSIHVIVKEAGEMTRNRKGEQRSMEEQRADYKPRS